MKSENAVEVRIPSELGYEKVAMSAAASMAAMMGFSGERIEDLKTAVAEACINAIEHGNHLDNSLRVGVESELEVRVSDEGPGPEEALSIPDIDRKMSGEEETRGMGMFLIQALVDEVEWHAGPPGKNYIRLVIRLKEKEEEQ